MTIFFRKISKFILFTIFIYLVIGFSLETLINRNTINKQYLLQDDWHLAHKNFYSILFIGNSRTYKHIDIEQINKKLKTNAYCLAQDGRDSRVLYYKLCKYLQKNKKPRQIYLQFEPYFISKLNNGTFHGKASYLSYIYGDKIDINHLFKNEQGFNCFEVYLPLLRYFHCPPTGLFLMPVHFLGLNINQNQMGNDLQDIKWQSTSDWSNPPITTAKLTFDYIDSIVNLAKKNEIEIKLIYSPQSYNSYVRVKKELVQSLEKYAHQRNIVFLNFNSKKYNNINLFYNHMHLNKTGAQIFTKELIDSLNSSKSNQTHQGPN